MEKALRKKKNKHKRLWKRVRNFMNTYTSLIVIIAAALLLELTTGVLYYVAQGNLQNTMEGLMKREMNAINLCIRNKLADVEVTLDNMSWVVGRDLQKADWVFETSPLLIKNNPSITGSAICFVPYYYPQKGRWFEPCAIRKADGSIETMQLGSARHDYTKAEFYTVPMATGSSHWCEPYADVDGTEAEVTTYSVPVRDDNGKMVAVVIADISLDWLEDVMSESKVYQSTQRFLTTGSYNRLAGRDTPMFRKALDLMKADGDNDGYFTMEDEEGEKRHVTYTPVGGKTDWVLINILDDNEVFGKLRRTRSLLLLPVMIGLLLAGFVVWRSSRNLERLRKANAEKDRIKGELRVASHIQQSMLPDPLTHQEDVDICGLLEPAREVGGDLYDYFVRDEKLFFCIGDVSGKGTPSAMLMALCHALFRSASAHESNPARIMHHVNEVACQGNESNMFITLFIGVLDLPTGRLRYCNAGHDAPFTIGHRGAGNEGAQKCEVASIEAQPNLPIGVFDDTRYEVQETELAPGSTIFLYTDGLTEAKNRKREQFGMARVQAVLNDCAGKEPKAMLAEITEVVGRFVKNAVQSDDLTMLAIRYTPKKFESMMTETLVMKNDVHEVTRFSSFMKTATEKMGIEKSLARQLRLGVEEAVVNVINYAYPPGSEGEVTVRMMSDGHTLHFQIIDEGVPFDPTKKEKIDTMLSAEDRQIGGLGIHLVRELMDSINYERDGGKNVLTLIKKLNH